jgi:hypothetical protein
MRLPICKFDIENESLCPSCQERLDRGEISEFDVEMCKWLIEKLESHPVLEDLELRKAVRIENRLVLIVRKGNKNIISSDKELMEELESNFGEPMFFEGRPKLRSVVRMLIAPAVEVGVNSLYLPNGFKENIVMLRPEDKDKIDYSKDELRSIVSAVIGESVLFQYQDERIEKEDEDETDESFDEKMREFGSQKR